ncbi:HAD family hydrolase [Sediminicola luteus]|uniref:Hydrolase n=1 Tax=Sediminicola luteus TaxID=319238 RepID=A0A2A4G707_9FLAO|nr:HAD family hydrolase [Sediminicola luteus]PCE63535.1 hypothetical protein B7P33_15155 [Sediminicola luteus]
MEIAAVCTDLDGTFLSLKNDITEYSVRQIQKIKDRFPIVLASARSPKSMLYLQKRMHIVGHPMICYNGTLIYNEGHFSDLATIPHNQALEIHLECKKLGIHLGLYYQDKWLVPTDSERVQKEIFNTRTEPQYQETGKSLKEHSPLGWHKLMLMGTKTTADAIQPLLEKRFHGDLHIYRSNDTLIEIAPAGVSKLTALEQILGRDGVGNTLAFGDNYNDMELMAAVGKSVAVANARPEVLQLADDHCGACKEDGVAYYLASFFN